MKNILNNLAVDRKKLLNIADEISKGISNENIIKELFKVADNLETTRMTLSSLRNDMNEIL